MGFAPFAVLLLATRSGGVFPLTSLSHLPLSAGLASMVCVEGPMAEVSLTHRGAHRPVIRAARLLGINSVAKVRRAPECDPVARRITAMGLASCRYADAAGHADGDLDCADDHRARGRTRGDPYPLMGFPAREPELPRERGQLEHRFDGGPTLQRFDATDALR